MKDILNKLVAGEDLSRVEMEGVFARMMAGEVSEMEAAGFLVGLRAKGESRDEVLAAASVMRKQAHHIDAGYREVIDTCGTGGSGLNTFNISTIGALVCAGAGAGVAKHGNRASSGKCGSADVLAELGFDLEVSDAVMEECLQEEGIAFLFAPKMHPAMANVMPVRKGLGIRTIFNILGPLANPAGARGQLLGVFDGSLTEMFADVLAELGSRRVMVVHGENGLDEISPEGNTKVSELRDGAVRTYDLDFEMLMGESYSLEDIRGGDAVYNAQIVRDVLSNKPGAYLDTVVANSAAAIVVAGLADDMAQGVKLARESIASGAAASKLATLIEYSKG